MLGVVCTGAAFVLYYRLIARVGAGRASTVTYLIPVFGVAWAWALLDAQGVQQARYSDLHALDAEGDEVPAHMHVRDGRIVLEDHPGLEGAARDGLEAVAAIETTISTRTVMLTRMTKTISAALRELDFSLLVECNSMPPLPLPAVSRSVRFLPTVRPFPGRLRPPAGRTGCRRRSG